jgi:single-strand selective monofunctional uracil DNA glycosylase
MDVGLVALYDELRREVAGLSFGPPVSHVYNPLDYAWQAHRQYLERYGHGRRELVLLGMNPGPWGMAQTGVPFGEVGLVRDWLGIETPVGRPDPEHPKRPVDGFGCTRSEVSGRRLWGFVQAWWGEPERFFATAFVANYCPLAFLEASGRNRTPDRLPAAERDPLFRACDRALAAAVGELEPELVVGVGAFAARRAAAALARSGVRVGQILHPSPASPAANRGWAERASRQLEGLGISLPPARE